MFLRTSSTTLHKPLVERIRIGGPITFADYMETCLYHPELGYYSGPSERQRTDYYTSVDMSPIFGRLIARQLHEMWLILGCPGNFCVAECGAGSGALAVQILDFSLSALPSFYESIDYKAIEISEKSREVAAIALAGHVSAGHASIQSAMPQTIAQGCVLTNEFLDALPVHRVVMEDSNLQEIYVDAAEDELVERKMPISSPRVNEYFRQQQVVLREGQHAEAALSASDWIGDVGRRLGRGFVLTIDYGREARELYDRHHMSGTVLAYWQHRASEEFYRAPGEQDLTSHVNFTALDLWGRKSGLVRTGLTSQTNFLLSLARQSGFGDLKRDGASESDELRSRLQFKSLIFPEGMGETFQVMVQHKGIATPELAGLKPL